MPNETNNPLQRFLRKLESAAEPNHLTDTQLLARYVRDRDEEAFKILAQRHSGMVWRVCCSIVRDLHVAEDAFQATFLVLVRKANAIARPELLGNWLYGVAYRVARRARKMI